MLSPRFIHSDCYFSSFFTGKKCEKQFAEALPFDFQLAQLTSINHSQTTSLSTYLKPFTVRIKHSWKFDAFLNSEASAKPCGSGTWASIKNHPTPLNLAHELFIFKYAKLSVRCWEYRKQQESFIEHFPKKNLKKKIAFSWPTLKFDVCFYF